MLTETSARGLRLAVGTPRAVPGPVGSAAWTRRVHPLTRQQLLQLIGPIIPEHARRRVPQETSVEFDHASASGGFKVTIMRNGSEIGVSIVPDLSAPSGIGARVAPSRPSDAAPTPTAPGTDRVVVANPNGAPADRSAVSPDGRGQGVRPASVIWNAAARAQGRTTAAARGRGASRLRPREMVALLHPITPHANREEFARAQRHRLRLRDQGPRPASAPTCSSIARAAAPCSASSPRRSSPPRSSACRRTS